MLDNTNEAGPADNAGVRRTLTDQATAPRRPDSEVTPTTCRSDEERARAYAGLLAEGVGVVGEGKEGLERCAAKLTALQDWAGTLRLSEE